MKNSINPYEQTQAKQNPVAPPLLDKENTLLVFKKKIIKPSNKAANRDEDQEPAKPLTPHHYNPNRIRNSPLAEDLYKTRKQNWAAAEQSESKTADKKALPSISNAQVHTSSTAKYLLIANILYFQSNLKSIKSCSSSNNNKKVLTFAKEASSTNIEIASSKTIVVAAPLQQQNSVGSIVSSQDREGLLQENIQLKRTHSFSTICAPADKKLLNVEKNNDLIAENIRLKTKLMATEKENQKLQKLFDEDTDKKAHINPFMKNVAKGNDQMVASLKNLIKDYKKEIEVLRQESAKIKKSVKYTRINELEVERKGYYEETVRLMKIVEQQISLAPKRLGETVGLDGKVASQAEIISVLTKELEEYKQKLRDKNSKIKGMLDNPGAGATTPTSVDRNTNKVILGLKKSLKQKDSELETLRKELLEVRAKTASTTDSSIKESEQECQQCLTFQQQKKDYSQKIKQLQQKHQDLIQIIEKHKQSLSQSKPIQLREVEFKRTRVKKPDSKLVEEVGQFLNYRFRAHHLPANELQTYLCKKEVTECSLSDVIDRLLAEPFFILNKDYLQALVLTLFYGDNTSQMIEIDESLKKPKAELVKQLHNVVGSYTILQSKKEEEMFIQIAELVTNYCQHISTAFDSKRNGEGTISKQNLEAFLNQIQLEKEYIEFIITQIILESEDLAHLNYFALFQIFYLSVQEDPTLTQSKNLLLYGVSEPVKELDQEYEQSHSRTEQAIMRQQLRESLSKQEVEQQQQM